MRPVPGGHRRRRRAAGRTQVCPVGAIVVASIARIPDSKRQYASSTQIQLDVLGDVLGYQATVEDLVSVNQDLEDNGRALSRKAG